jgi:hypothetical protein
MAKRSLLSLREAADRLASHGVGQHLTAVGAPPIAKRGPKGEALYSGKALDAWAAALPRRGRVAIGSEQASGKGPTDAAYRRLTAEESPQPRGSRSRILAKLRRRTELVGESDGRVGSVPV